MNNLQGNIGIIGVGVVGNAIKTILEEFHLSVKIYDKYKKIGNNINELLDCYMIFLCLPTLFITDNTSRNTTTQHYDKSELYQVIEDLSLLEYEGIIVIKSTIEPGTTECLQLKYKNLILIHNPEFLSAKTASMDFKYQNHIIIGYPLLDTLQDKNKILPLIDFYKTYFPKARLSITTSNESEMAKITCNSFYACKIQFFTEIKLFCDKFNISYDNVKSLIIKNGWINPMHLDIPGHDGHISFGGACLPKDIQCLNSLLEQNHIDNEVINAVVKENKKMRDVL